jgi:hypothetical protein
MMHVATADPLQVHVPFGCRSEYQGLCSGTCLWGSEGVQFPVDRAHSGKEERRPI